MYLQQNSHEFKRLNNGTSINFVQTLVVNHFEKLTETFFFFSKRSVNLRQEFAQNLWVSEFLFVKARKTFMTKMLAFIFCFSSFLKSLYVKKFQARS